MKYAFLDQGLISDNHEAILEGMKNHLKNNYCESLKARGELDNCDEAKALEEIKITVTREAGYPIDSG